MNKNKFLIRTKNIIDKVYTISFKDNILYIIVRHIIIVFKVITATKSNNNCVPIRLVQIERTFSKAIFQFCKIEIDISSMCVSPLT